MHYPGEPYPVYQMINDALSDVLPGADCTAKLNLAHFKAQRSPFDIFSDPFTATVNSVHIKTTARSAVQQSESKVSRRFNTHTSLLALTLDSLCLRLIRFFH